MGRDLVPGFYRPDLFSRFLGESERSVRRLFAAARERAPSVIFLDELDALAAMRGT